VGSNGSSSAAKCDEELESDVRLQALSGREPRRDDTASSGAHRETAEECGDHGAGRGGV